MSGIKVRDKNQRRERGVGAPGSENPRKKKHTQRQQVWVDPRRGRKP